MLKIIDHHCHFEQLTQQEQHAALADFHVVGVASDYLSCCQLLALKQHSAQLDICLGIHPEHLDHYHDFPRVAELIKQHQSDIIGIGEIGLPYFSLVDMPALQRIEYFKRGLILFEQFIKLANQLGLPVNLHCVGDETWQAIECLNRYNIGRALFHWFAGSGDLMKAISDKGWFISVSPDVITNTDYQNAVKNIPKTCLCLESDGPWPYEGQRGVPNMMLAVADKLGSMFDCTAQDIITISQNNAQILWRIDALNSH